MSDNPYVGPRPFGQEDANLFFGRDREARQLSALASFEQLVLLYAPSGAGKTSLIETRLIPALMGEGFRILPVGRVAGDLPPGVDKVGNLFVFNLLSSLDVEMHDPALLAQKTLSEFLDEYCGSTSLENHQNHYDPVQESFQVLLVDQFEEILIQHQERWNERFDFFRQLAQALRTHPSLSVILSMREDYLAQLDPYASLLPDKLRTRFRLGPLGPEAALAAIAGPAVQAEHPFAPGVAERLVDDLRQIRVWGQDGLAFEAVSQFVEPMQLQIVCYRMWDSLRGQPAGTITLEELARLGDVNQSIIHFYEEAIAYAVAGTGVSEKHVREWCEYAMITPMHTRAFVPSAEREVAGLPMDAVVLLMDMHLLRAEFRRGMTWYELIHDRFIAPILASNQEWLSTKRGPKWLRR
jgi:hypothetical protein